MSRSPWRKIGGWVALLVPVTIVVFLPAAQGREARLTAGLTMRQEYDSNYFRTRDNPDQAWISTVSPSLNLTSPGQYDELSLLYEPGYSLNRLTDTYEINHQGLLAVHRNLSSTLRLSASDNFVRSSDPEQAAAAGVDLADKRGRRVFRANNAQVAGDFAYRQNSLASLGYANTRFVDESQDSNDYERHSPSFSLRHQFTPRWQSDVSYAYTRGLFAREPDLTTQAPGLGVTFLPEPATRIFATYLYSRTDYDSLRDGYIMQNGSLGFSHGFNADLAVSLALGKYYLAQGTGPDNAGYSYDLSVTRKYRLGEITVQGTGGMDDRQFSAAGEGLTKFWSVRVSETHRVAEAWSAGVGAFFRENRFLGQIPETREASFGGSANISLAFWRWFRFAFRYSFSAVDAELETNDYHDHRLSAELSAIGELWRW